MGDVANDSYDLGLLLKSNSLKTKVLSFKVCWTLYERAKNLGINEVIKPFKMYHWVY